MRPSSSCRRRGCSRQPLLLLLPMLVLAPVLGVAVPVAASADIIAPVLETPPSSSPAELHDVYDQRHGHCRRHHWQPRPLLSLTNDCLLPPAVLDRARVQTWTALACRRLTASCHQIVQEAVRPVAMTTTALLEQAAPHPTLCRRIDSDEVVAVASKFVVLAELAVLLLIRAGQRSVADLLHEARRRPPRQLVRSMTMPTGPEIRALAPSLTIQVARHVVEMHAVPARFAYRHPVTGPLLQHLFPAGSNRIDVACTILALVWLIGFVSGANPIRVMTYQFSSQGITIKRVVGDFAAVFYGLSLLIPHVVALARRLLQRAE